MADVVPSRMDRLQLTGGRGSRGSVIDTGTGATVFVEAIRLLALNNFSHQGFEKKIWGCLYRGHVSTCLEGIPLTKYVRKDTRIGPRQHYSYLNLVITNKEKVVHSISCYTPLGKSHHRMTTFTFRLQRIRVLKTTPEFRNFGIRKIKCQRWTLLVATRIGT